MSEKNNIRTYSVDEMLNMQVNGNFVHSNTNEKYFNYELAEIYHQRKLKELFEQGHIVVNKSKLPTNEKVYKPFVQGKKSKMFNQKQIDKILQLRKNGLSYQKIANEMNCSKTTIINYLKSV